MPFQQITDWQVHDDAGRRKYLSEAERHRFLAAAGRLDTEMRVLCRTLVFTGCRITEALSLSRHQLDLDRLVLTVKTLKRRRSVFRAIPIPASLGVDLAALAVGADQRFWTIHRATAWRLVKKTMDAAEIIGPMASCKGLRHGFGIRAAGRNVPPNLIQRWMGHSSPTTTAIYLDAVGHEERGFAERMWDAASHPLPLPAAMRSKIDPAPHFRDKSEGARRRDRLPERKTR